ncbi:carbohydrate kinase family protein [Kallotenue papyrolyticum]|uniref:carbohydrate kinase family protein n=1 Tax=Kallotenue papyrolyticum TaxID=1325125 RepID=UPI001376E69F|nr:carbohydrate kinase family protein [Kallotenue papyrolyticum]
MAVRSDAMVICYGSILPDRVLRLPRFPRPGEGLHALDEALYLGGEPCNVGGHLAAWEVPVLLAGNDLGCDAAGAFVRSRLAARPNTTLVVRDDDRLQTPTCYVWATPDGERTMIPSWPKARSWALPDDAQLRAARLVSVSIYGPGMEAMIELARQHARPLAIADVSGPDDPRLAGAAIVTTSRAVLRLRWGVEDAIAWMRAVAARSGALVVVSDGPRPLWALTPEGGWWQVTPPAINVVDTTGAGDALKAGVIYGWLQGWPLARTLRWAVAAASLQCQWPGACERAPTPAEITALMARVPLVQRAPEHTIEYQGA